MSAECVRMTLLVDAIIKNFGQMRLKNNKNRFVVDRDTIIEREGLQVADEVQAEVDEKTGRVIRILK